MESSRAFDPELYLTQCLQQLQTDVELRLRQNGIKVLSEEEKSLTLGMPSLYVRVSVMINDKSQLVVYSISLQLQQNVLLLRDPTKICPGASTWDTGSFGTVGESKIGTMREDIKDKVDEFINDYLAVNPKK